MCLFYLINILHLFQKIKCKKKNKSLTLLLFNISGSIMRKTIHKKHTLGPRKKAVL
jgi:hypothetical protein